MVRRRKACARIESRRAGMSRGFTLVELLTVIAVIAVLVSMLLPAINKVRASVARVNCESNMRQLMMAVHSYCADNDRQLPYCNWEHSADDNSVYGHGWMYSSPEFRTNYPAGSDLNGNWSAQSHIPLDGVMTGVLWPYLNNVVIYHCPVDNPDFFTGTEWLSSYLMNGSQCGFGNLGGFNNSATINIPGFKMTRVLKPSDSVLLWEALEQPFQGQFLAGAIWNDGSSYPTEEVLSDRHFKGANVACVDGHVEWWDQQTWTSWSTNPSFNRLWWDPGNPGNGR